MVFTIVQGIMCREWEEVSWFQVSFKKKPDTYSSVNLLSGCSDIETAASDTFQVKGNGIKSIPFQLPADLFVNCLL